MIYIIYNIISHRPTIFRAQINTHMYISINMNICVFRIRLFKRIERYRYIDIDIHNQ